MMLKCLPINCLISITGYSTSKLELVYMTCAVVGLYLLCVVYALIYRRFAKEIYHDSQKEAAIHIVQVSLTIILYLYDCCSDSLLCYHYYKTNNEESGFQVGFFTVAPVFYIAFVLATELFFKIVGHGHNYSYVKQVILSIPILILTALFIVPAIFIPLCV